MIEAGKRGAWSKGEAGKYSTGGYKTQVRACGWCRDWKLSSLSVDQHALFGRRTDNMRVDMARKGVGWLLCLLSQAAAAVAVDDDVAEW